MPIAIHHNEKKGVVVAVLYFPRESLNFKRTQQNNFFFVFYLLIIFLFCCASRVELRERIDLLNIKVIIRYYSCLLFPLLLLLLLVIRLTTCSFLLLLNSKCNFDSIESSERNSIVCRTKKPTHFKSQSQWKEENETSAGAAAAAAILTWRMRPPQNRTLLSRSPDG